MLPPGLLIFRSLKKQPLLARRWDTRRNGCMMSVWRVSTGCWLSRINWVKAKVIIVVAGMEGALPSVVGGLVEVPVIAVPTSVGYGTSFAGIAPLLSMLNSCSSGVTVVNIDNGFGAAMAAMRMVRLLEKKA